MKLQLSLWLVLKRFLIIFLPLLALASGISVLFYYIEAENNKREKYLFETNEVDHVNRQMKTIINGFNFIKSDLIILTGHAEMRSFLERGEVHRKNTLAEEFLLFCNARGVYDQVRFLDEKGMEVVRINYNIGNPYIVQGDQLKFKGDRYYFKDTFKLDKGELFVSPFDLNIEGGKIEKSLKPMIRFGTTVFDSYGQKRGIVVLNYLGVNLINELKSASENDSGSIMLLNSNGYWLHGVKPEDEWGFMYEDRKDLVFGNTFPEAWSRISADSSGHFYNADGLFTYTTVYPLLEGWKSTTGSGSAFEKSTEELKAEEYTWKIVSYVGPDVLSARLGSFTIILISIYGSVIVLIGCGSWFLASSSVHQRIAEERITSFAHILEESLNEIYIFDAKTLRFIHVNKGARLNLGYSMKELSNLTPLDLKPRFTDESFVKIVEPLRVGEKQKIEFTTVYRRRDGSLYDVEVHLQLSTFQSVPVFVAIILDITKRKKYEEQIKASLKEKEVLLKEIHHRVKNNMQVMASLLRLQSEGIKDKHLLDLFDESRNRIKSMALIHEDLYSGKDLARIDFDQYTRKLTGRLISAYEVDPNRIITSVNIDNVFLGIDTAIPCGLIINELFTNSLKYAFPHIITDVEHIPENGENRERSKNKGEVRIDCHSNSDEYTLVFSDNGVGLPEDKDFQKTETLGLDLVRTLVKQLKGTIELNRSGGTEFTITFRV